VWLGLVADEVPPSPNVQEREEIVPSLSEELSVNVATRPFVVKLKFAVGGTLPPPPWLTIACEIAQELVSFDQLACSANVPVLKVTLAAPPVEPAAIQAHSSEFSWPA